VATRIRRILVVIRDLHRPPRIELRKAAEIARAAKATVELFHVVDPGAGAHAQAKKLEAEQRFDLLAGTPLFRGLRVTHHSNIDYPPHEAIVRRAVKVRADLVIVATRTRGLMGRVLLRNTDWELIRQCTCPLLLVKSPRAYTNSVVLAAVDPFHSHSKPANLDARLLDFGGTVARLLKGSLHVFHAYMPLVNFAPVPGAAVPLGPPPEVEAAHTELIASEFNRTASAAGVTPRARHLHMGIVSSELCATAKSTRASMVVMGAVSRSALRRIFIGSTAEAVLDKLTCDVLVLKPAGFRSSVGAREFKVSKVHPADSGMRQTI
jgi:universal stress protein E